MNGYYGSRVYPHGFIQTHQVRSGQDPLPGGTVHGVAASGYYQPVDRAQRAFHGGYGDAPRQNAGPTLEQHAAALLEELPQHGLTQGHINHQIAQIENFMLHVAQPNVAIAPQSRDAMFEVLFARAQHLRELSRDHAWNDRAGALLQTEFPHDPYIAKSLTWFRGHASAIREHIENAGEQQGELAQSNMAKLIERFATVNGMHEHIAVALPALRGTAARAADTVLHPQRNWRNARAEGLIRPQLLDNGVDARLNEQAARKALYKNAADLEAHTAKVIDRIVADGSGNRLDEKVNNELHDHLYDLFDTQERLVPNLENDIERSSREHGRVSKVLFRIAHPKQTLRNVRANALIDTRLVERAIDEDKPVRVLAKQQRKLAEHESKVGQRLAAADLHPRVREKLDTHLVQLRESKQLNADLLAQNARIADQREPNRAEKTLRAALHPKQALREKQARNLLRVGLPAVDAPLPSEVKILKKEARKLKKIVRKATMLSKTALPIDVSEYVLKLHDRARNRFHQVESRAWQIRDDQLRSPGQPGRITRLIKAFIHPQQTFRRKRASDTNGEHSLTTSLLSQQSSSASNVSAPETA